MIFLRSLFPCPMIASPILSHVHYLRFGVHFVFFCVGPFSLPHPILYRIECPLSSHHITSQQKFCVVPPLQLVLVPLGTDGPQYISYNCLNTPAHVVEFFRYQNFLSFSSFGRAIPPYPQDFPATPCAVAIKLLIEFGGAPYYVYCEILKPHSKQSQPASFSLFLAFEIPPDRVECRCPQVESRSGQEMNYSLLSRRVSMRETSISLRGMHSGV